MSRSSFPCERLNIEHKFSPGDKVQLYIEGVWRDAVLLRLAPYERVNCPGYYYQFDPLPKTDPITRVSPSQGGWISENCVRRIE